VSENRTPNPNVPTESEPVALDPSSPVAGFPAKVAAAVLAEYVLARKPRRAVASALRISPEAVERIAWAVEPLAFPSLRFEATAENVAVRAAAPDGFGRSSAPRADRLALRAGVSVGKIRALYAEGTGADYSTRYPGLGRRYAESRIGAGASPEAFAPTREAIRAARAEGKRGDAAVAARAVEILAEKAEEQATAPATPKAKRPARK
jgi:hypothetical protein